MANDWNMSGWSDLSFHRGKKARILVVDDFPLVREGLIQIFKLQETIECCGEAGTGAAAQKMAATAKPDLVTVEIRLPDGDGLELIKFFKLRHPELLTLVITQCDEAIYADRALKAGARGYVMKERATDDVLMAIQTVLAGGFYVSPKIAVLALHRRIGASSASHSHPVQNLTDRELQVLQFLGAGLSTRMAAGKLFLSIKTVETHRENIKRKLGLKSAAELLNFATDWVNGQPSQYLTKENPVPPKLQFINNYNLQIRPQLQQKLVHSW